MWRWFTALSKGMQILIGILILWLIGQLFGILFQESYVFANYIWEPFRLISVWDPNSMQNQNFIKPVAILRFIVMVLIWLCILAAPILFIKSKYQKRNNPVQPVLGSPSVLDFENDIKELVFLLEDSSATQRAKDLQLSEVFQSVYDFVIETYEQPSETVRATLVVNHNDVPLTTDFKWGFRTSSFQDAIDLQMVTQMNTALTANQFWTKVKDEYRDADKNSALFIRNIGTFKLGILFSFKNEFSYTEMEERTEALSKSILPFALLGLIDSIRNNVIQYTQGGGENVS